MSEERVSQSLRKMCKIFPSFALISESSQKVSNDRSLHSSTFSIPSYHSAFCSIKPTYNFCVLRADNDITFAHYNSLQQLSKLVPKLQLLTQDYDFLICVKFFLKVIFILKYIEQTMISVNISLESINLALTGSVKSKDEILVDFKTLILSSVEKLEKCLISIDETLTLIKTIGFSCSHQLHYDKMINKFRNLSCVSFSLSYCKLTSNYVKDIVFKVLLLQSYLMLPLCDKSDSSSVSAMIYCCDRMLKLVLKLSYEIQNTFRWKLYYNIDCAELTQLLPFASLPKLPFDFYEMEGCNVTSYVRSSAEFRSFVISKKLFKILEGTLSNYAAEGVSDIHHNSPTLNSKSKEIINSLDKNYMKFLTEEQMYISNLIQEINDKSKHCYKIEDTFATKENESNLCYIRNNKYVYWDSNMGPTINNLLCKLYIDNLWNSVVSHIKNTYIICLLDSNIHKSGLNNSDINDMQSDVLCSCIKQMKQENCSDGLLKALSALLIAVTSFHKLQQWDQGICKVMGAALKDKCRYNDTNVGSESSAMINVLLSNQVRQIEIYNCFQIVYRDEKLIDSEINDSNNRFNTSIFLPSKIFFSYIATYFKYKRQYYLIAGCWEQFFVVISCYMNSILRVTDPLVNGVKENLAEVSEPLKLMADNLITELEEMKSFEQRSLNLFYKAIAYRTRKGLEEHMPTGKVWRRVGQNARLQERNTYISVLINLIFPSLLENLKCLPKEKRIEIFEFCFKAFWKSWRKFILDKQIMFSWFGGNQLRLDFEYLIEWFSSYNTDEPDELQSLDTFNDMRNIGLLLACQPPTGKSPTHRLSISNFSFSEESIGTFIDAQFDEVIDKINLQDKEQWLSLRVKSNKPKKFLCIS